MPPVCVLPAHSRSARCQFGVNEGAQHGHNAAGRPHAQDKHGRVQLLRHHVRVDEDASADNAAHHDHGGVEQANLP